MNEEKQFRIDIPESIEGYKVTLFWGLGLKQIVLLFISLLFIGFGVYSLAARHVMSALFMFFVGDLSLLGILEIQGRNFYYHLLFIFLYYQSKPQALIYSQQSFSAKSEQTPKQLVYEKSNNNKLFVLIILGLIFGLILFSLTIYYISHVIHK